MQSVKVMVMVIAIIMGSEIITKPLNQVNFINSRARHRGALPPILKKNLKFFPEWATPPHLGLFPMKGQMFIPLLSKAY